MALRVCAFTALSLIVLSAASAAQADDCGPLKMVASVNLVPTSNNTWQFVPVSINGTRRLMLLDTGGYVSEITPQAVAEFNLAHREIGFQQTNVAGQSSHEAAVVPSFAIGQLSANSIEFVITPEKAIFGDDKDLVGIIGPNILTRYDVDADFGAHKLNLMSPDHCEGKVIYWAAAAVAVLPIRVLPSGHIAVKVMLDGKEVRALLDTGASNSTLTASAAESDFGVKLGSPDTPYVSDLQEKPGAAIYTHRFSSLSFGDIAVSNPQLSILPDYQDRLGNAPSVSSDSRIRDPLEDAEYPDMLIGMNVLRHLHVYIAYKEQKLYITPAGSPALAPAATKPPHSAAVSH